MGLGEGQTPAETIAAGLVSGKKEDSDVGERPQGGGKWRKKGRCVVCEVAGGMYVCVWCLCCVWCTWCVCGVCIVSDFHGVCVVSVFV